MAKQTDIELLADLNIDSSEQDIIKSIKIIEKRLNANHDARFKLNVEIDETVIKNTIEKLQKILKSKDLSIDTQNSIKAITDEVNAMADIVTVAKKASTEKLNFSKANEKVKKSADDTASAINRERNAMGTLEDLDYILANVNMHGVSGNNVFQTFGRTLNDAFSTYTVANLLTDSIRKTVDVGKEAIATIKELDDTATSLRMATGASKSVVDKYMSDYNEMGQMLGEITTSTAQAADSYLRQGHSVADTNELIKDSLMLSHIANLETADSTDYLTSILRAYKLEAGEVLGVVDRLSKVDLSAAVDAGGIAEAMSKTATSAQQVGVNIDQLIGMVTTVGEVTQAGMSEVGNSIRTIFSRMRDIKDGNLTSIGEDGEIKTLSNIEGTLDAIGVKLRSSNDEFRNFYTVLDETASKWKTLTSVQKAAVTEVYSGVRQSEKFNVLMENWDKVREYAKVSETSAGTATEKFQAYLDSLEAKSNSLKASLEKLASTTISDELYASVLDTSKAMVDLTTDTGILKGLLVGLGTSGSIYVFRQLASYLGDASQGFANFNEAMNMTRSGTVGINNMQRLIDLTGGLSQSQTRLLLSTNTLTDAQKIAILVNQNLAQGMSQEMAEATARTTLNTWGLASAQQAATTSVVTLDGVLKGLWATLMANPLVLVTAAVAAGAMTFNSYKNHVEEVRRATEESATAYKESASSIDDYVAKYQDLRQALIAAKGDEQETYNIKQQLLDLQTELNNKFGEEYGKLNLVTDAYKDQTEAIKAYNQESAKRFLNENRKGINTATNKMTKKKDYVLSGINISLDTVEGKALNEIVQSYVDDGMGLLNTGEGMIQIHLTADAENAYNTINDFLNDLREEAKDLGNENLFADIFDMSTISLNDAKDTIEEYGNIYKQALMAQLVSDDDMSALYNEALNSVEQYNQAVISSEDPYSDEKVANAKKNLDEVRAKINENLSEWGKYSSITDDLFEQADTKLLDFNTELKNNKDLISDAQSLKLENYSDVVLKSFNPGENEAFDRLKSAAEEYDLSVEQLIDALIRLGYVQGEVQDSAPNFSYIQWNQEGFNKAIKSYEDGYSKLAQVQEEWNETKAISASSFAELQEDGLLQYLEITADGLQINTDKLLENAQSCKDKAVADLHAAMTSDLLAIAIGDTSNISETAQSVIEQLGNKVEIAGDKALSSVSDWATYDDIISQVMADAGVKTISSDKRKEMSSVYDYYKKLATDISNIDITVPTKTKKKSDTEKAVKDVQKATKEYVESYLEFQKQSLEAGRIDYQTYSRNVSNFLKDMYDQGKIAAKDYHDYTKQMLEAQKDIYDKALSAITGLLDDEIDKYEECIKTVEKQNDTLEKQKTLMENAASAVSDYYQKLIDGIEDANDAIDEQNEKLEEQLSDMDDVINAVETYYDTLIDADQKTIDSLNEKNDSIQSQIEKYDSLISVADQLYTEEQDNLKAQQDSIQEKIDLLQEENDQKDLQYRKEEALYELQRSQQQRTKKLYVGDKGYIYDTDKEAIRDAQKNLQDIETEELVSSLEKEKEALQDSIDSLQEYRDALSEISDAYQKLVDERNAAELLGDDYKNVILGTNIDDWLELKDKYIQANNEISDNEDLIKSREDKIKVWEEEKEQWSSLTQSIIDETNKQKATEQFGADWEKQINEGRFNAFDSFKKNYLDIQSKINDNTETINSNNEKIEQYNKLKDEWDSLTSAIDENTKAQAAIQMFGADWEKQLNDGRLISYDAFKNQYLSIESQINDNTQLIDSYNEKIEYYESLKKQWSDITSVYEKEQAKQYAAMLLGENWEADVLSGRLDKLNDFKKEYIDIQQGIVNAAWESANEQVKAAQEAEKAAQGALKDPPKIGDEKEKVKTDPLPQPDPITVYNVVDSDTGTVIGTYSDKDKAKKRLTILNKTFKDRYYISPEQRIPTYKSKDILSAMNTYTYASGTRNAKKGLNLVGEDGTELYEDNDGNVSLVTEPTLIPMEGGETVKNATETKKILNNNPNGSGEVFRVADMPKILAEDPWEKMYRETGHEIPGYFGYSSLLQTIPMYNTSIVNTNNNNNSVSIGEIHLHEVQDAESFADDVIKYFPGKIIQEMYRR